MEDSCVAAGAAAIEITCRRPRLCDDIRRVREAFPDLLILVGSVVDDGPMLRFLQSRRPDMPSLGALADLGVDGFVSAMPLSRQTLERFSTTHLLVPGVETVAEAVAAVEAGAHCAKFFTASLSGAEHRIRLLTSPPLHRLLPIFVTGGVTLPRIDAYFQAGAALLGPAYMDQQSRPDTGALAAALRSFLDETHRARRRYHPASPTTLHTIPHYHPFPELPKNHE